MTKLKLSFPTAAVALALAGAAQLAHADSLPFGTIREICAKYEGQPALISKGATAPTLVTCPWVEKLSAIEGGTVIVLYRRVLGTAKTLAGLRQPGRLPSDLACGDFAERARGNKRTVECTSNLGIPVPFIFVAGADGTLEGVEIPLRFRQIYRLTMTRAVERGTVSKFYDTYVDLQTDLQEAKLRYTSAQGDSVTVKGDVLNIFVTAPK